MRTVHLGNAATQTFDFSTLNPHKNHSLVLPKLFNYAKLKLNIFLLKFVLGSCCIYQWNQFYERILHPLCSLIFLKNTHFLSELLSYIYYNKTLHK